MHSCHWSASWGFILDRYYLKWNFGLSKLGLHLGVVFIKTILLTMLIIITFSLKLFIKAIIQESHFLDFKNLSNI